MASSFFYSLLKLRSDLQVQLLLPIAHFLQPIETWILDAFGWPTHTILRMFPPQDISDYTRVDAQVQTVISIFVLLVCHVGRWVTPPPLRRAPARDHIGPPPPGTHWVWFAMYWCEQAIRIWMKLGTVPYIIAFKHAFHEDYSAGVDVYTLFRRYAFVVFYYVVP